MFQIGKLPAGSIFGEDEIVKRIEKRKYSAKACQPLTFIYIIKKDVKNKLLFIKFLDIL